MHPPNITIAPPANREVKPPGDASAQASTSAAADDGLPGVFGTLRPTLIALILALCIGSDLVSDIQEGAPTGHMIGMAVGCVLSVVALVVMWRLMRATRARARALQVALDSTRVDLMQWRSRTGELLQGLGALIDRQFDDWALSTAEREVAVLLLKGLSLNGIAEVRETSERTVRQQALAVYRKAGIAGRAELSAFFLEDLLLPQGPLSGKTPPPRKSVAGAQRE